MLLRMLEGRTVFRMTRRLSLSAWEVCQEIDAVDVDSIGGAA